MEEKKPRAATMQVDVNELYATLKDAGLVSPDDDVVDAPRVTAPPPLPPGSSSDLSAGPQSSGEPQTSRGKMIGVALVAVVLGVGLAVFLGSMFSAEPEAVPEAAPTSLEIGPIEVHP
ncbi:MAG: hypothetical protein AAF411_15640 [Myxococcota bacterium]